MVSEINMELKDQSKEFPTLEALYELINGDDNNGVRSNITGNLCNDTRTTENIATLSGCAQSSSGQKHSKLSVTTKRLKTCP